MRGIAARAFDALRHHGRLIPAAGCLRHCRRRGCRSRKRVTVRERAADRGLAARRERVADRGCAGWRRGAQASARGVRVPGSGPQRRRQCHPCISVTVDSSSFPSTSPPAHPPVSCCSLVHGDEGWEPRYHADAMARQLVRQGAMVTAIDWAKLKANLEADGDQCVFPDGDLENLSHFVQAYFHSSRRICLRY